MNLTEIQIDCHGLWRNVNLAVRPRGLTVYYGPNEAGKTTVREFIRGVFFGFARGDEAHGAEISDKLPAAGSLIIEDSLGTHRIHRAALGAPAEVRSADQSASAENGALSAALGTVDERLFDRVFSVGLRELTEFSGLSDERVAPYLYGLTLGPDGERILEAARRVETERSRLIDPLQTEGEMVRLFERQDELVAELKQLSQLQERHSQWCLRRDQLEGEIADLRHRHAGTRTQLRGHEFLERVWGPWSRIRECRNELELLPEIAHFPERGMQRLERLESRLAESAQVRGELIAEIRQGRAALMPGDDLSWTTHAAAMRGFVEQRGWFAHLDERCRLAATELKQREQALAETCALLGEGWTAERVMAVDVSAAGQQRLSGTAESLLAARSRRKTIKWNCRQLAETCRDLRESLAESLHDLDGRTIEAALAEARARLGQFTELAMLRLREAELAERLSSLAQHRERIMPQLSLPKWVYVVLGLFAFMGVILAGWGLVAGVAVSGIAGAIYAMLGVTCGGLAWGLKIQYEGDAKARLSEIESSSAAAETELAEVRDSIQRLAGAQPPGDQAALVSQAQSEITDLLELAASQRQLQGMRRQLAQLKKKLATSRREVATARACWNELLAGLGFPATDQLGEALAAWQRLADAAERIRARESARKELETLTSIRDAFRERLFELASRLEGSPADAGSEPVDLLDAWEERLRSREDRRIERRELRRSIQAKLVEARRHGRRARRARIKRDALLVQGGAARRDEFEERARAFARRTLLADQWHDAQHELNEACHGHSDLALVEEDLERFDPRENAECIRTLRLELGDLERDIEQALEHLGGVKNEIESLENDRQATRLLFEMGQIEDRLRDLAKQWLGCESAAQVIDEMRRDFERAHQPRALLESARIFARLTGGKYVRVWTPLGARRLIVEDAHGRSFPVQALSRGTREQLLLAVRLALVREMHEQGISLPLILDDVIVNFDEERAAAAAEVLLETCEQGQQVLFFTCHKHIAQLFASRGIEPTWLPSHSSPEPQSEEKRLAG